jgi:hypothetical protein
MDMVLLSWMSKKAALIGSTTNSIVVVLEISGFVIIREVNVGSLDIWNGVKDFASDLEIWTRTMKKWRITRRTDCNFLLVWETVMPSIGGTVVVRITRKTDRNFLSVWETKVSSIDSAVGNCEGVGNPGSPLLLRNAFHMRASTKIL